MDTSEEINDESDHEHSPPIGYYTRSKRRKLNDEDDLACGSYSIPDVSKRKNPIMFVPTEVVHNVFRFLTFHELSNQIRLVNRRFKNIAEDMLNFAFKRIEEKIKALIKSIDFSLPYIQDDMEVRCVLKLLNMLEILDLQYGIIYSTIWRYVYNPYYKTQKTCMYGGLLIDVHQIFLWKFTHNPNQLYAPAIIRDYALPTEITKIIQMTKSFCVHFDKINEEGMQNCCLYSGCKILDILDVAKFSKKTTYFEDKTNGKFSAKYSYFFSHSWFIALPIPASKSMEQPQKQRMMHMRLRRVSLAHNDMMLQQSHYEREIMLRASPSTRIKKPGNNVYTGYGDVEDSFFYYGVMNDGAYAAKFNLGDDNDEEDDEEDVGDAPQVPRDPPPAQQDPNEDEDPLRTNSEEDVLYRLPHLGFRVDVDVTCPLSYAPWEYLKRLGRTERRELRHRSRVRGSTELKLTFECYGAYYPRLPIKYIYDFKARKN